jgi:hypothetical protein
MPKLIADGVTIPTEIQNDCDPGDRYDIRNATIEQSKSFLHLLGSWINKS